MFILTCQIIQLACMVLVFRSANKSLKAITAKYHNAMDIGAQYALERDRYKADLQTVCNTLASASKAPEGSFMSLVLSLAAAQCKTFQETACAAQRVLDGVDAEASMFGRSWVLKAQPANPVVGMAQAHVSEIVAAMGRRQDAEKPKRQYINRLKDPTTGKRETVAQAKARIGKAIKKAARRANRSA